MCQVDGIHGESNKMTPLDVSPLEPCGTNASTIPLDKDNEGWSVHQINPSEVWDMIDGPIVDVCTVQEIENNVEDPQKKIRWETLTEMTTEENAPSSFTAKTLGRPNTSRTS